MPRAYRKKETVQLRAKLKTRPDTSRGFSKDRWSCRVCRAAENEQWRKTCWRCSSQRAMTDEDAGKNEVLDKMIEQRAVIQWLKENSGG